MSTIASGTVTNAAPAATLQTALDTPIVAGGFTFVETFTDASSVLWNIYKSPSGSNSQGADWYLGIGSNALQLYMTVMELWTSGTHLAGKYVPTTTVTPDATDFSIGSGTALLSAAGVMKLTNATALATTGVPWWISVNVDRVVFSCRPTAATNHSAYFGLFDRFLPSAVDPFPLCMSLLSGGGVAGAATHGGATREPLQSASNAQNFHIQRTTVVGVNNSSNPMDNYTSLVNANDTYTGVPILSRMVVYPSRGTIGAGMRGLYKDVLVTMTGGVAANLDTMTITVNGTARVFTCVQFSNTTSCIFLENV